MAEDTQYTGQEALIRGKFNLKGELRLLEDSISELKVKYEQFFAGIIPREPEKEHADLKRAFRMIRKAPFKTAELSFRIKALEHRYNTFNTYWQRVMRERDQGIYSKDTFKAELRDRAHHEAAHSRTRQGAAERGMKALFDAYRSTLEKETGKIQDLDFKVFQSTLAQKAREFKEQSGAEKVTFRISVKDGRVSVQAKAKEE
jgi:hypothetical protein